MLKKEKIKSRTKKVIFVITLAEIGGAQKYVRDLSKALSSDYDITVASNTEDDNLFSWSKSIGVSAIPLSHLSQKLLLGFFPTLDDWKTFRELYTLFKNNRYDIVHLNSSKIGFIGAIAARLAGVRKIIFTAHGWVFNEPESIGRSKNKKWVWILISKLAGYFQDKIICVSNYDFDQAIKYHIAPPRKMVTIYNGLNTKKVRFLSHEKAREWLKQQEGINELKTVIGTIANHYPTKDLPTMVRALKHLPDNVVLVIIGDGPEREALKSQITNYKLQESVFLLGRVPDAAQYLRAFDVYAISSLKEGLPFSALEAIAAGVPIISTPVGGLNDIFFANKKNATALVFSPGDANKLAERIKDILANKDLQNTLTKNAERTLKKYFTLDEMVTKTRWVYDL